MERFLSDVCSLHWNDEMDAGRSWEEAIEALVLRHPDQENYIRAYRNRWPEMLGGLFEDTLEVLDALRRNNTPLYALTNWAADTFDLTKAQYPFLNHFQGIVVSGREGIRKPNPEIFRRLLSRYDIAAPQAVFIDDNGQNVAAAAAMGMRAIHFQSASALRSDLQTLGFDV